MTRAVVDPKRVALHPPGVAAMSTVVPIFLLLVLAGCLAAGTEGFRDFAPARLFCGLAFGGAFAWMASARLRYMPLAYGSPAGLDLEWAWGDKRHVDWQEVLEIRVNRVSSPGAKRFRVYLADEAFELSVRADFPELVAAWRVPIAGTEQAH